MSTPAQPIMSPWGKPAVPKNTSPWGSLAGSAPKPCSLQDVMSEELAKELHDKEETKIGLASEAVGDSGSPVLDLSSYIVVDQDGFEDLGDLQLAQKLQAELDAEEKRTGMKNNDVLAAMMLDGELNTGLTTGSPKDQTVVDSDLLLAQMLQHEYDCEHDELLTREENKLNGSSKVTLNFTNYRTVHPALVGDEESEEDEDDYLWEEIPAKDTTPKFKKGSGISGKGKNIVTKHDSTICGRKNATRIMDKFPPEFETGDGCGIDMKLSNKVYNKLKQHSEQVDKRSQRLHEKKEHSTAALAVDQKTRLILYKLVNNAVLEDVNGVVSAGKEAVIFHADGGSMTKDLVPEECAIKVFKTSLNEFKNRAEYLRGDYRFTRENAQFKRLNPRIVIKMWAQKEEHNLRRLESVGVPCPHVVLLRKHVLVMSFIGRNQHAAPKLKDAELSTADMQMAYEQTIEIMRRMYNDANLVHGDFSEFNLLWHEGQVYVIDVSQAVVSRHPQASEYLLRDCRNVCAFFKKAGVPNVPDKYQLFNEITGLNLNREDEGLFLKKLEDFDKNEERLRMEKGKEYPFEYFFTEAQRELAESQQAALSERLGAESDDSSSGESGDEDPKTDTTSTSPGRGASKGRTKRNSGKAGKSGTAESCSPPTGPGSGSPSAGSGADRAKPSTRAVRFKESEDH